MTGPCNVEGCDCGHTIEALRRQNAELREACLDVDEMACKLIAGSNKLTNHGAATAGTATMFRELVSKALANTKETP